MYRMNTKELQQKMNKLQEGLFTKSPVEKSLREIPEEIDKLEKVEEKWEAFKQTLETLTSPRFDAKGKVTRQIRKLIHRMDRTMTEISELYFDWGVLDRSKKQ